MKVYELAEYLKTIPQETEVRIKVNCHGGYEEKNLMTIEDLDYYAHASTDKHILCIG